jgi:uncharacterized protein (TIGR03084 family)
VSRRPGHPRSRVTTTVYGDLLADLETEQAALDRVVVNLAETGWRAATPAAGWDVRDSIAHLAFSEDLARATLEDPDEFRKARDALVEAGEAALVGAGRTMPGTAVLDWWRGSRAAVLDGLRALDGRDRLLWFAGPMSAMSFATARLMETWAHGQDVRDALGRPPSVSGRLRHVADLGVRSRPFAYVARGRAAPDAPVRVELTGPDGDSWTWGDATADVVGGPALDFCLVVTQRRNPADTALEVAGPAAAEWISIAQAFAGPATDHRPPRSG